AVYRACDVRQADLAAACRAYNTAVAVFSPNVAGNQLSCVEVMRRRLAAVLSLDGIAVSPTDLPALALLFDNASRAHWRPMNGVTTVVRALARNHALGIVSNGWDSLQHDKIDACELT